MKFIIKLITSIMASSLVLSTAAPAAAEHHQAAANHGHIDANPKALGEMFKLPMDEEIHMLNMIKLKDKAEYPDGSEFAKKGWTGAQAYAEYRRHAGPIVARLGGSTHYTGVPQLTLIGPEDEQWDSIFIIYYPDVTILQALFEDPEYQKHAFHRKAGVADSRLIRMAPAPAPKQ
ncbi:DUF1330 domain-containing protein [Sphingorhabdus sp. Alg231-15]|uniref:DUF1330 domain-containing protein n=1 Tax=Sphingorhabdus sp. Alg231-15 TaxID=1922222 RepID=UPI00307C3EA0